MSRPKLPVAKSWANTLVFATLIAVAVAVPALAQQSVQRGQTRFVANQQITFEQRLLTGLRVKTPADEAYINRVAAAVRAGQLPVSLVDSSFFYARARAARPGNRLVNNPIIYFRIALEARTRALGISF